jgi:hypothetical protein
MTEKNRQLQAEFGDKLEKLYGGKCMISDDDCGYGACHIVPHCECNNFKLGNGLLLRKDLHLQYDDFSLTINPHTLCVEVCENKLQKSIGKYNGKKVNINDDKLKDEIIINLKIMYDRYCIKHKK